jgi:3-hydroxyisobutyrate dehydrogenase
MNVGYVGLGDMGGALARRLQLKYQLAVFDLDQAAVQRLVDAGATAFNSASELAEHCDVGLVRRRES